jgi:hypothetical protein
MRLADIAVGAVLRSPVRGLRAESGDPGIPETSPQTGSALRSVPVGSPGEDSWGGLLHERVTGWVTQPEWLARS